MQLEYNYVYGTYCENLILESQKDLAIEKKEKQRGIKVRNAKGVVIIYGEGGGW